MVGGCFYMTHNDTYGEDIGVEALYDFNRAMEKDD